MIFFWFNRSRYLVLECLGPDVPASYLMKVDIDNDLLQFIAMLDNNTESVEFAAKMAWPRIKQFVIPLPGNRKKN